MSRKRYYPEPIRMPELDQASFKARPAQGRQWRQLNCIECPHYWPCRNNVKAGRPAHCEATAVAPINGVPVAW